MNLENPYLAYIIAAYGVTIAAFAGCLVQTLYRWKVSQQGEKNVKRRTS